MKKKSGISFLILAALLFACPAMAEDYRLNLIKKFYSMGTASINGTYYPVGNSIARLFSKKMRGMVVLAEPTPGSVANIEYLRRGQIDLALIQSDVAWQAFNGTHSFAKNRYRELRILASLYSEVIQIIVRSDSEIRTIRDLRGKKISVGERDSGSAASVMLVLEAAGLERNEYTLVYERFTRATESLNDGYVDAVYYAGGVPADGIARLAEKSGIRLVSVPQDVRASILAKFPYFTSEVIVRGTYKGLGSEVSTVGFRALLVGSESIPAFEISLMLPILFDNVALISDNSQKNIQLRLDDALKGVEASMLHEAALKFYTAQGLIEPASAAK